MSSIFDALSQAALHAGSDPTAAQQALQQARRLWPELTVSQQQALQPLGRHLGLMAETEQLGRVLERLHAGDYEQAAQLMEGMSAAARKLLEPILALGDQTQQTSAQPEDDWEAQYADYADLTEEDLDQDPGGFFDPSAYEQEAAASPARTVGIQSDLSPSDLLARAGLGGFRPGQEEAVQAALDGRDSLVVMPTGGGKSLCYQLPASASDDLTVVVSPLIALIADQHQRFSSAGVRSVMFASSQGEEENRQALRQVRDGSAQVAFCAPERFASKAFRGALQQRNIALFVVDEAHCISEWGHDFRPDYLRLLPVINSLGRPPIMACTATATPKAADEIVTRLGLRDPQMVRRGFDRPNLSFDVVALSGTGAVARKRGTLLAGLSDASNRPAVVYCGTRKDTVAVTADLNEAGIRAVCYHAGMDPAGRTRAQEKFMRGEVEVVVATNAFGMGVDKADIRSVWHWALPTSVEAYYQEAGRAGRDGKPARAVLLAMRGDLGRLIQFIKQSELSVQDVRSSLDRLRRSAVDGVASLDPRAQEDRDRVALAVAERSGAISIAPAGAGMLAVRFEGPLDEGAARRFCKQALDRRWEAYKALRQFADTHDVCRRRQLLDHFGDDEPTAPEGRCCDVCDELNWLAVPEASAVKKRKSSSGSRNGSSVEAPGDPVDAGHLQALKSWRAERADGKPAYMVASNATLEEILRRKPRTANDLQSIKGVGPAFMDKHAESLLAELAAL